MACSCKGQSNSQEQAAKTQALAEARRSSRLREERAKQQARENAKK